MNGIQFLTDGKGNKVAVQIDLRKHKRVWEDFYDGLICERRKDERSVSYEQYRASRLKKLAERE